MGSSVTTEYDDLAVSSINAEWAPTEMTTGARGKGADHVTRDNRDDEMENPARPKGAIFVILSLSILPRDLFVAYICDKMVPRCCRAQHRFV